MRHIVSISLPETLVKEVKREVKSGGYATTSEFFRHLLRLWRTEQLARELRRDKKEFERGRGREIRSLRDLQ